MISRQALTRAIATRHHRTSVAAATVAQRTQQRLLQQNSRTSAQHQQPRRSALMGSTGNTPPTNTRLLWAFDFDHTLVDGNTDTHVIKAHCSGTIPAELKHSYEPGRWTEYMQRVLTHLHSEGVTVQDMQQVLQQLPYVAGMEPLLQQLQTGSIAGQPCHCIILSDSNSEFIEWILSSRQHRNIFSDIYTNPATQSPQGTLLVTAHHSHDCPACPVNMCKRQILQQHTQALLASLNAQQEDDGTSASTSSTPSIITCYVGDGGNDLCPAQSLGPQDFVFVRAGYALHKLLQDPKVQATVKARQHVWESGDDILQVLSQALAAY